MLKKIMAILNAHPDNDYKFLGYLELDGAEYVLVTSPASEGEGDYEVLSVYEVDKFGSVDEYSFSIVEEEKLIQVFMEFCKQHNQEEAKDVQHGYRN
jgi:hypothetical protein